MKITVAMDSFKGSLTSLECGRAVSEGLSNAIPSAEIKILPLADGGEGTSSALTSALGGTLRKITVRGPLGNDVEATYGIIESRKLAVMEMASAAGLSLVPENLRNPLNTSTFGVGEMICDAIEQGCRNFIVGIGGSSTNDGGAGMLTALGFRFLDCHGNAISNGAKGLESLCRIETGSVPNVLNDCSFTVACDVTNPLFGDNGCSRIYGPQKGADPVSVEKMDKWMKKYAEVTKASTGNDFARFPGAGAAGGLGFAFISYLNAELKPGVDIVLDVTGAATEIADSDLLITGEGRIDSQTTNGKAPFGISKIAENCGVPVVAIVGSASKDARVCNDHGIDAFFSILQTPCTLDEALDKDTAYFNVRTTAEQIGRLIVSLKNLL